MKTENLIKPRARTENIITQCAKNEILIYDLVINKAYCLNQTAAFIWQRCDGIKDVAEIAAELAFKYQQPINENIVWLALSELEKDNLMAIVLPNPLSGVNRRQAIRQIGLATMIALPLVSSIVAPSAVEAASTSAITCTTPLNTCIRGVGTSTNLCAGCAPGTVGNYDFYNSVDGSCTGLLFRSSFTCTGPRIISADVRITSFS